MEDYFLNDPDLEEALLKTFLLFLNSKIKEKRDSILTKYILALVLSKKVSSVTSIKHYFDTYRKDISIDNDKIKSVIIDLKKQDLVFFDGENISIPDSIEVNAKNYLHKVIDLFNKLVEDLFNEIKVNYGKTIVNETQVKVNIKRCLEYYFEVMGLSFFDLDIKKDIKDLNKIVELAEQSLAKKESKELSNHIIYAIGRLLDSPTEEQEDVLRILARVKITAQILHIDPLLNSFKATILRNKVFILDTDVVLFAITENASLSSQYRMMINELVNCGCKVFIPEGIIQEVYNHAEAATKRYYYNVDNMSSDDRTVVKSFNNVFLEDYYFTLHKPNHSGLPWDNYISNYFNKEHGIGMTLAVIKNKLGQHISYGKLPTGGEIKDDEKAALKALALEETMKTPKAFYRQDSKNENIAETDTAIFLTARSINSKEQSADVFSSRKSVLLSEKCYILTNFNRIYACAKSLDMEAKVFCKPAALIAYLAEIGVVNPNDVNMTTLLDNPFLIQISNTVWPEVEKLMRLGVDVRGKNLIRLRFDLDKVIHDSLTIESNADFEVIYNEVISQGYSFNKTIEESMADKKRIAELENSIKEKDRIISGLSARVNSIETERRKEQYLKRAHKQRPTKTKTKIRFTHNK